MIANRRTYYFHPAKIGAGIALVPELLEHTIQAAGRGFKIMRCLHGPMHALVFEMRYKDETDMQNFSDVWYPMLTEKGFIARWFANVKQMTSEIWSFPHDENAAGENKPADKVDGYWGPITHRLAFQPYASGYNAVMDAAAKIASKTRETLQKDLLLSQCYLGTSNIISIEADFQSVEQQTLFAEAWLRWLESEEMFVSFFVNIQQGTSELWQSLN